MENHKKYAGCFRDTTSGAKNRRRIQILKTVWGLIVLLCVGLQAQAQEISVLTTTWIPYAYESNGRITGMSTEIVRAILNRAGLTGDIQMNSWNRAIITAKTQKNILIYPLMRIPQREDDFIWVSPIFDAKLSLFKLKKNKAVVLKDLNDAKAYSIGVLKGAAMHQFLVSKGFEDNVQLHASYSNRKNVELLFRGRIDLVADNPLVVAYEIKQLAQSSIKDIRFSYDQVQEVLPLTRKKAYMAFGKESSPEYVTRLRNAWQALDADGSLEKIFSRYQ